MRKSLYSTFIAASEKYSKHDPNTKGVSCIRIIVIKGIESSRRSVIKLLMCSVEHNRSRNSAWPSNGWSAYFRHQNTVQMSAVPVTDGGADVNHAGD